MSYLVIKLIKKGREKKNKVEENKYALNYLTKNEMKYILFLF